MKTILCYGDSNTWGDPPGGIGRHPWNVRWPGVLQSLLGPEYRVIEEGLNGRTTYFDDPSSPNRNGLTYLPIALESHSPLDLLIVMLGTNDVKYSPTALGIAEGAAELLAFSSKFEPKIKNILLVSPPHIVPTPDFLISDEAIAKSLDIAKHYQNTAKQNECHFFDAASVAKSSSVDGIHLDAQNHQLLAKGLCDKVEKLLKERV